MKKLKINLDLLLPEIPDEKDKCVNRIIQQVQQHKGIENAHIVAADEQNKTRLCFHYDPDKISLEQVQQIAEKEGAAISEKYNHLLIEVSGIKVFNQAEFLEQQLEKISGIADVSVSAAGLIHLEYDQTAISKKQITDYIEESGFLITSSWYLAERRNHAHPAGHTLEHHHGSEDADWKTYLPAGISFILLASGLLADFYFKPAFFTGYIRLIWYAIAYLPVGWPVAAKGITYAIKGDVFTEFFLMTIATVGAFCIREYPEGVAVMLFYTIGELFQDAAVNRAKRSIKALLDIRPDKATVFRNGEYTETDPNGVNIGETIQIKAGEKVPLDGELLSGEHTFNTAALTGESRPQTFRKGQTILAGMINEQKTSELKVSRLYSDSALARILTLVQEATARKAKTEQFIRKFSGVYTPIVVLLALCIVTLPYFFIEQYQFREWLYRALIFLVISCPCALVISIPLGYFGGIGAASRNGILFKGSNFLDLMTKVNTIVMDKTGTLTKGVFKVQKISTAGLANEEWLPLAAALESRSNHPAAQAVVNYTGFGEKDMLIEEVEEISGYGMKGRVNGREIIAGNLKLMDKMGISLTQEVKQEVDTLIAVAVDKQFAGYITIADELKEDSRQAVRELQKKNIRTVMLSGDKQAVVDKIAGELGIDQAYGDLLPEDKVHQLEKLKKEPGRIVAFVGDGINDAPVLALSDVGIAMGGLGSDAAIETADVVIQTDQPSKLSSAITISRATNKIVWQNIAFAFIVKAMVMLLGAGGLATMWEAVFADVGVALLAILNAVRIQKMKFQSGL